VNPTCYDTGIGRKTDAVISITQAYMSYTLGIDLHKHTSTWVLIDADGSECWKRVVPVHPTQFTKSLSDMPAPVAGLPVAIEPVCGWRWVSALLAEAGCAVHHANPLKLALIAKSTKKNDRLDALTLARLLKSGFFPESYRVSDAIEEVRQVVRARAHLVTLRTSVKNRLHGLATAAGAHTIPGGNPLRKAGRAYIDEQGHQVYQTTQAVMDDLTEHIRTLEGALASDSSIKEQITLLTTIPGIGIITAATIIAESGDINRFPTGRHYASYAGLVPRERSSGGTQRFGSITKTGPRLLRSALVEAAMRIRPGNAPELHAHVASLAGRTGAKKARVALARRLATVIHAMVTKQVPYDPSRIVPPRDNANVSDLAWGLAQHQ
jgi:transposase